MKATLFFALLALSASLVLADLPIHCLQTQVAGEWAFEVTDATSSTPELCGYRQPDKNAHHLDGSYKYKLEAKQTLDVSLTIPNVASFKNKTGTWTMVYDEGFWVNVEEYQFFAFHKYAEQKGRASNYRDLKAEHYVSYCDETLVGWYQKGDKFGCWKGKQTKKAYPDLVFKSSKPTETEVQTAVVSPVFLEVDAEAGFANAMFEFDHEEIARVNSDPNSLWKAKAYHEFMGKTNADMLKLAGGMRFNKNMHPRAKESSDVSDEEHAMFSSFLETDESIEEAADSYDSENEDEPEPDHEKKCEFGLPCSLDWRNRHGQNWIPSIVNQGRCGSCYVMAFMTVMESRLRIAKKKSDLERYSPQSIVSCSVYNQGCDGGFPFLVGKHIEQFGIVSNKCFPYKAKDLTCSASCKAKPEFPIKDTKYVGGYFGNNSEEAMMRELLKGPITVAFESPKSLFSYSGGIFEGPRPRVEDQQVAGVRPWQHTNHAVVAVGWGHTKVNGKRVKYWIMRNSWGKHWGEDGYFRIIRGRDECGVEGMSVTTTAVV